MKILVLDDLELRHNGFAAALIGHDVTHVWTVNDCCQKLQNWGPYDRVYLDHDLNDNPEVESMDLSGYGGTRREQTGYDVALFIVRMLPEALWPKEVVIHSLNIIGAQKMFDILTQRAGIPTVRAPFSITG